eukprot:1821483-Rhodomonas_salina.1
MSRNSSLSMSSVPYNPRARLQTKFSAEKESEYHTTGKGLWKRLFVALVLPGTGSGSVVFTRPEKDAGEPVLSESSTCKFGIPLAHFIMMP